MSTLKSIRKYKAVKILSSIKITVVCLFLLFVLTFWGTIAQVDQGLYQAQERYFTSLYFLAFGFIPLPGAQLVLWILFINLVCVSITRFVYKWSHLGILVIHMGLLSYFVSAFVTLHCVEETNIMLREGASSNVSSAYHKWELSLWSKSDGESRQVTAFDIGTLQRGSVIEFPRRNLQLKVLEYFPNSEAYVTAGEHPDVINDSGVRSLKSIPVLKEPEKNFPGGFFALSGRDKEDILLLYGGETRPTKIVTESGEYFLQLRRRRSQLPFQLKLKDFRMEVHPNTDTARSYESLVEIEGNQAARQVLISMNEPLRHQNYTLYQASYAIDQMGRQYSTLAVVKNSGRILPYISSLLTFAGLVIHFLGMSVQSKTRRRHA